MTEREHMIARLKKCDYNVWGKNGLIHCITDGPIRYRRNKSGSYVKQATDKLVRILERIVALEAENAKMRELLLDCWDFSHLMHGSMASRYLELGLIGKDEARELGIEVSE